MSIGGQQAGTAEIEAVPVRHPWRWVSAVAIAVLAAMVIKSFFTNSRYDWSTIWHYAFTSSVLHGVLTTLELTVVAMLIGIVGGIVLAIMRLSPNPVLSSASWFYIWLFRGTPVIVQILISIGIPFGPEFATADTNSLISALTAGILALGLNEAAYMAEIVRAGILSVDEGQSEAAAALGMQRGLVMRRIVLPQAMRVIIPPTGNETISMLKSSSLVSVIVVTELLYAAQLIYSVNFKTIQLLIVASCWYILLTSVLYVGQYYVERYYGRGTRTRSLTPLERMRIALFALRRDQS
jgi:polar amino acid transport system permease protein